MEDLGRGLTPLIITINNNNTFYFKLPVKTHSNTYFLLLKESNYKIFGGVFIKYT